MTDRVGVDPELCLWCGEPIDGRVAELVVWTEDGPRYHHRECAVRTVTGGIGHLVAHEYWCSEKHDPDGGLTARQSARLAYQYWLVVIGHAVEQKDAGTPDE